ncbi:DUF4157 domain-containing protein [Streptomyces phaeochromogenes]|uniref:eCIS core domain-containing protein n=1 Tax=Streptomyces phaeochromogenes TaxID=1923 RepID=UPI0036CBF483
MKVRPYAAGGCPRISLADSVIEREADRTASRVSAAFDGSLVRARYAPAGSAHESSAPAFPWGHGEQLPPLTRSLFESRFHRDLSTVRIHPNRSADLSARALGALALVEGDHVGFRAGQYAPETRTGRRLLAHELAHIVDERKAVPGAVIYRQEAPDLISQSILPPFGARLTDAELEAQIGILRRVLGSSMSGGFRFEAIAGNLAVLENEVMRRSPLRHATHAMPAEASEDPAARKPEVLSIPTQVEYSLLNPEADSASFGLGAAAARSTAIGGARGLGFLLSPPIRGRLDPFMPLFARMRTPTGGLGLQEGGVFTAERYLTRPLRDLRPRHATEAAKLFLQEGIGKSEWLRLYNITERQLSEMPGLMARMAERGIEVLTPSEQKLITTYFRAHAENFTVLANPAISATIRPQLSAVKDAMPFLREAPYRVRVSVPASTVGEVNAVLGTTRPSHLVNELEVLVFTDARGSVTSIEPNPTSSLGTSAGAVRWIGRGAILVAAGVTVYRIEAATTEELPRVLGEEGGGWAGGAAGSAAAAGGCLALGIATGGAVLLLCGLAGGIAGGAAGSYLGGEVGESLGRVGDMTPYQFAETSVQMFGTPQEVRDFYELRAIMTGETEPFDF